MASKRQRKKQEKKKLQQRFKTQELTYRELKEKEAKADRQRLQREKKYQDNLKLVKNSGVNINITKSMTEKQVKDLIRKEKQRQSRKRTQEKKIKLLMDNGLSRKEAEEFKNAKFEDIYSIINTTYTSKKWVGVAWGDVRGEADLISALKEAQDLTTEDKIAEIHKMYEEALNNPQDSNSFTGIARFVHGVSKEHVESQLEDWKKRDYTKIVPYNYVNIGVSNQFSLEGVVDMMYIAMARTTNFERTRFYKDVEYFLKVNVPQIYKRIF